MSTRTLYRITAALLPTLVLFRSPDLHAGSRQRAVAVSPPSSALSLTFTSGGAASVSEVIEVGTISWSGGRKRVTVTTRKFGVRIGRPSREARGTATLRAFLETPDPRATIRIDGIVLGAAPVVIAAHAPIGIDVTHTLEIEIPVTAPEGPLAAAIGWEVTSE